MRVTDDVESAFDRIYNRSLWGAAGSKSGDGSNWKNTRGVTNILLQVIASYGIRRMIDAPCGAMAWQLPLLEQLATTVPKFEYFGMDIVRSVVEANRDLSASNLKAVAYTGLQVRFSQANLVEDSLPSGYDLILSRDALQHNLLEDVWSMLYNYGRSDARWLLIGSYPNGSRACGTPVHATTPNRQIRATGGYFCIDVKQPPFSLRPHTIFPENTEDRKFLYLFDRRQLAAQLTRHLRRLCMQLCEQPTVAPPYDPGPDAHRLRPYNIARLSRMCTLAGFGCRR